MMRIKRWHISRMWIASHEKRTASFSVKLKTNHQILDQYMHFLYFPGFGNCHVKTLMVNHLVSKYILFVSRTIIIDLFENSIWILITCSKPESLNNAYWTQWTVWNGRLRIWDVNSKRLYSLIDVKLDRNVARLTFWSRSGI